MALYESVFAVMESPVPEYAICERFGASAMQRRIDWIASPLGEEEILEGAGAKFRALRDAGVV